MSDKKQNKKSPGENNDQNMLGISFEKDERETEVPKPEKNIYEDMNAPLASPRRTPRREGVFNVERAFDNDNVEIGTIVSDKKLKRTPIIKSLKSAFNEWWSKTKKTIDHTLEAEVAETEVELDASEMPSNEDRTEIIKKATEYTTQAPKEDHEVILEKVKTLSSDAEKVKGVPYEIEGADKKEPEKKDKESATKEPKPITKIENKKEASKTKRLETPDLRKEMVAPVVKKRIQKDIHTYKTSEPKKEEVRDKKPKPLNTPEPLEKPEHKTRVEIPIKPKEKSAVLPPIKTEQSSPRVSPNIFVAPKVTEHSTYKTSEPKKEEVRDKKPKPLNTPEPLEKPEHKTRVAIKKEENVPQTKLEWHDEPVTQPHETKPVNTPEPLEKPAEEPVGMKRQSELPKEIPTRSPAQQVPSLKTRNIPKSRLAPKNPRDGTAGASNYDQTTQSNKWRFLIRLFIIIVIVGVGVTLAIFAVAKLNIFEKDATPTQVHDTPDEPVVYVPAFFQADIQTPIHITGNKKQFLTTLKNLVESSNIEVTQFYPVVESGTVLQTLSTQEIFKVLNTRLDQNPINVLEDVSMFGGVITDRNEPYIIIRSYSFDTLFAGLLDWEPYMYDDLSPLFEKSIFSSTTFVDAVKDNASIRILYDENGDEVMLYAFINRNTVIITSSTEALSKIIKKL